MAATREGGLKTARTIKRRYGTDYYVRIGAIGGKLGRTGGFYGNRQLATAAGRIGGMSGSRNKNFTISQRRKRQIAEAYKHLLAVQKQWQREREGAKVG